jgi:uncharacterized protein YndB with AHSA1/START domain
MSDPLQIDFEVACTVDDAFAAWTERIDMWWPADHTVSGGPAEVIFEGRLGGRIYERTRQGDEHDWGVVTEWQPPRQLAYRWHLGSEPDSSTDVVVRFSTLDEETTRVEIEQTGWERLGDGASEMRNRNRAGWDSLIPLLRDAIQRGV